MELSDRDMDLVSALADGLPLSERPYAQLGQGIGMDEAEVIARLKALREVGVIRRFGVVVRHRELGFGANAMVVWNIPDDQVAQVGAALADCPEVTLCYRRPRVAGRWPYNLFCMVHGRDRTAVEAAVAAMAERLGLSAIPHQLLFSTRRFKQCGARYHKAA